MEIKEIKPRMNKIDVEGSIIEKSPVKEFQRFGNPGRVCKCVLQDDSGKINLTLWNDECDKFNEGDKVKVTNGYCSEFQGEKQLSAGKYGKLEIIE